MSDGRKMTAEERAQVSLRCRVRWHRWSIWLPIALSRPPTKKRLCFGCPKIEYARLTEGTDR